jgi:hypothetical protein
VYYGIHIEHIQFQQNARRQADLSGSYTVLSIGLSMPQTKKFKLSSEKLNLFGVHVIMYQYSYQTCHKFRYRLSSILLKSEQQSVSQNTSEFHMWNTLESIAATVINNCKNYR